MTLTDEQVTLLKLSKAKDGDFVVISSDERITPEDVHELRGAIMSISGKKLGVVWIPGDTTISMLEADEARATLEALASKKD